MCLREMGEDGACLDVSASGSGEAGKPQKAFLMSKCLILMHLHIVVPKYPHFIDVCIIKIY